MKQNLNADSTLQTTLVAALMDPARFPHPAAAIEHLETHISHILLAGDYAYKIKKPLNLGFVDFTSLERRRYYCEEELRLNRRLAPSLYLDCIPICGSSEDPLLNGDPSEAIEYAVKMARFPQEALLDRRLAAGALGPWHMDSLARQLADFYATIARADANTPFGSPQGIHRTALENFQDAHSLLQRSEDQDTLETLQRWTVAAYDRLQGVFAARKADGFIRECHGDLHLSNMILQDGHIVIFDGIEFNEELRWIDIMNDLAFVYMDLCQHQAPGLARRLLNTYLEFSGDYSGLKVFRYYLVYRAMVRAKIAAIRLQQAGLSTAQRRAIHNECRAYLDLALSFTRQQPPFLLITHGVSGSGKTTLTLWLLERLDAIRIRSDVERKRLFDLSPLDESHSALNQNLYTATAGSRTYDRLRELAEQILEAGYAVIVDATFLEAERRRAFRVLAKARDMPFVLLVCSTNPRTLRARIAERHARGDDAAEADVKVLEQQLQHYIPPGADENPLLAPNDAEVLVKAILARIQAQGRA